jgi:CspA family cold shock protein
MPRGTVLSYSDAIGCYFIRPDDGGEGIFVHRTAIAGIGESKPLKQGDRVTYDEAASGRKDVQARNVSKG